MEILMFCFFLKNLNCSLKKKKEPTWPFIKNPNQVHVHFLPYFYNSRIDFITKLDKVTSIIFK